MKKVKKILILILLPAMFLSCSKDTDYSISYSYNESEGYITDGVNVIEPGTTINYSPDQSALIEAFPEREKRVHFLGWWLEDSFSFLGNDVSYSYDNPYSFVADAVVDNIVPRFEYEKNIILDIIQLNSGKKIIYSTNYEDRYQIFMMDMDGRNKEQVNLCVESDHTIYPADVQIIKEHKTIVFWKSTILYSYNIENKTTTILYSLPITIEKVDLNSAWVVDSDLNYFATTYYSKKNNEYCYRFLVYDLKNNKLIDNSRYCNSSTIAKIRMVGENVYYIEYSGTGIYRYNIKTGINKKIIRNSNYISDFEISPHHDVIAWTESCTGKCTIVNLLDNSREVLAEKIYDINSWTNDGALISVKPSKLVIYNSITKDYRNIFRDVLWNAVLDDNFIYQTERNEYCYDIVKIGNDDNAVNLTEIW